MTPETNGDRIRYANEELLEKGNLELVDELFTPGYVVHVGGQDIEGPDFVKRFISDLRSAFPDLEVTVAPLLEAGDRVAFQRTVKGTHQGEIRGVSPTGRTVEWRTMIISRFDDGKIAEEWGVSDLAEQLIGS